MRLGGTFSCFRQLIHSDSQDEYFRLFHIGLWPLSFNKHDIIYSTAAWEHFGVFPRNLCGQHIFPSLTWISRRGATVHFSCDEGYELQGSKSISCLRVTDSYVGWSDDRPICRGNDWIWSSIACRWYLHAKVWWCWCWLFAGLSFCLNAQSIFHPSTFYQVISCHFAVTGLTLTFGSHSFPSFCLAMPAWCWQSLKSDYFWQLEH